MSLKEKFSQIKEAGIDLAGKAKEKSLDFADKAKDASVDFAGKAKSKAKATARIAKLNFEIKTEENSIEKAYREIGRLYYETCGDKPEGFFVQLCEEVTACVDHIAEMEAEIAAIKASGEVPEDADDFEQVVAEAEDDADDADEDEDVTVEIYEDTDAADAADVKETAAAAVEELKDAAEELKDAVSAAAAAAHDTMEDVSDMFKTPEAAPEMPAAPEAPAEEPAPFHES